ncbi:hypothetical protein GA0070624_0222 [Micromonospora rhizosphaerae]|uniref:Uncharacterized protein n=1 Tax=Micromonospora rhizosphaerae TaxID=568872 RepID=A0A1C6R9U8_9ACTN|nr:hypothetical protein [Micromonospora rhizosphaerae]SCL13756.1 hypothetical protein GA0070624_0222 [Micromonospora rhizosphaerae]
MSRERFVVHLPVLATDLAAAKRFFFCDRLLDGRRRCPLPADHVGECGPSRHR